MRFTTINTAVLCAAFALAGAAQAGVIATNADYGNFDGDIYTRSLNITSHGTISDVNLTVDFSKCDDPAIGPEGTECIGIGGAFPDEIGIWLTSPDGTMVELVPTNYYDGGSGRVTVTFDDQAAAALDTTLQSGSFRPVNPLSAFIGLDMFGTWTLTMQDTGYGDPLEYFGARLDVSGDLTGEPPASVPEPGSVAIVGLGLAGLAALRRKRGNAR